MKPGLRILQILLSLAVAVLCGIVLWTLAAKNGAGMLTMSLPFWVAYMAGEITVYNATPAKAANLRYRIFRPWPLALFFSVILICIDGAAHWALMVPLILLAASLGGLSGGYFKPKEEN